MRTSEFADAHRADTAVASQKIQQQKLRRNLCDRISDLARSDALLRRQTQEIAAACAAQSRESFNDFASTRLMRIAERACVRGDDSQVRPLVESALFFSLPLPPAHIVPALSFFRFCPLCFTITIPF